MGSDGADAPGKVLALIEKVGEIGSEEGVVGGVGISNVSYVVRHPSAGQHIVIPPSNS